MKIYYSLDSKGFYSDEVMDKTNMPADIVEINDQQHKEMLYQLNMSGKDIIISNANEIKYVERKTTYTWNYIRKKRNELLSESDYTQMPDYPGDKVAWTVYRQQLRDITETFDSPEKVVWPPKPNDK